MQESLSTGRVTVLNVFANRLCDGALISLSLLLSVYFTVEL